MEDEQKHPTQAEGFQQDGRRLMAIFKLPPRFLRRFPFLSVDPQGPTAQSHEAGEHSNVDGKQEGVPLTKNPGAQDDQDPDELSEALRKLQVFDNSTDPMRYAKGDSPIELLPNEILHQIWYLSWSLELPHASSTLSRKLAAEETKRLFVRYLALQMPFKAKSFGGQKKEIESHNPALVRYLIGSRLFEGDFFHRLQECAGEHLGVVGDERYNRRAVLKLKGRDIRIPLHLLQESSQLDSFNSLFEILVKSGGTPPPLSEAAPLILNTMSLGYGWTAGNLMRTYNAGHIIPPSFLETLLSNSERTSGHLRCVRETMSNSLGVSVSGVHDYCRKPKFHEGFSDIRKEQYPCLWRWMEVNLRTVSEKVLLRDVELATDGERVEGKSIAIWFKLWVVDHQ